MKNLFRHIVIATLVVLALGERRIWSADDLKHRATGLPEDETHRHSAASEGGAQLVDYSNSYKGEEDNGMNGNLYDRTTCAHGKMKNCYVTYDLGPLALHTTPHRLEYFQCRQPGFTNGGVQDFELLTSDSKDSGFVVAIKGSVNEHNLQADRGDVNSFKALSTAKPGRYWKFQALKNHGNGAYLWFCEFRLYAKETTKPSNIINVARNKPAIASSTFRPQCKGCYDASKAVDGRLPVWTQNSVQHCWHSGTEPKPSIKINLQERMNVTDITIVGRNWQTNQGDNLKVYVDNTPCGGKDAIYHTNGKGGNTYARSFADVTVNVPCNLMGSVVTVQTEDTVAVLCEIEVWAPVKNPDPVGACDGCAWRLKSCDQGDFDHWDVDFIKFHDATGSLTSQGKPFSSGFVEGFQNVGRITHTYGPAEAFTDFAPNQLIWSGKPDKYSGDWFIGSRFDQAVNVTRVEYMMGGECFGKEADINHDYGTHSECVELQKWDGDEWVTDNWHDELKSCVLYDLKPAGRRFECKCPVNLLNNGDCDAACNIEACLYDGGDCKACPLDTKDKEHLSFNSVAADKTWTEDGKVVYGQDAQLKFSCAPGYRLDSSENSLCDADKGTWNPSLPNCVKQYCDDVSLSPLQTGGLKASWTSEVESERDVNGRFSFESVVSYVCEDEHFQLVGSSERVCSEDSGGVTWDQDAPSCIRVKCPVLTLPEHVVNSEDCDSSLGCQAKLSCTNGFKLFGRNPSDKVTLTCTESAWDGTVPTCVPIDCGIPPSLAYGNSKFSAKGYKAMASYTCNAGYELVGDDTSTCGADEKWTSIGTCSRIHCAEVNSVVDASVTPKLLSTDTNENEVYTTVNFSCTSNYYVSGSKSMTCQEDGEWSAIAPSCIIKECPLLSDLDNGYIKMNQRDLEIGASVEYVCNTGYQLNSTRSRYLRYCNRDVDLEDAGSWDGEHVACLSVPCDTLPIQESIVFTPEDMVAAHRFGAFVPYNCSDGYEGPMGFFQCVEDGTWLSDVQCKATTTSTTTVSTISSTVTKSTGTTTTTTETDEQLSARVAESAKSSTGQTTTLAVVAVVATIIVLFALIAAVYVIKRKAAAVSKGSDSQHMSFDNPHYDAGQGDDSNAPGYADVACSEGAYADVPASSGYVDVNNGHATYMDVAPVPATSGYMDVAPSPADDDYDDESDEEV
eukprot:m.343852 g.343852  ORF g.343852 m.343852 type:complete len:1182 (+) comp23442_c0_seq1:223-3768(+)